MRPRLIVSATNDAPVIRPSARVGTVAAQLDEQPSQIRRMIKDGLLEAHKTGKRGVRVFVDSVEALQRNRAIKAEKPPQPGVSAPPKPLAGPTRAAHRQAMAHLQGLGLVPASRQ